MSDTPVPSDPVTANPWQTLRRFTDARIGLGRAGNSLPTRELLAFQLDHARAQDAVHLPLDTTALCAQLAALSQLGTPLLLHSRARDRLEYLQRPDLGRRLNDADKARLSETQGETQSPCDLALVIADGLSSQAVQNNTLPMCQALFAALADDPQPWRLAPVAIVQQGRVAVGDEVGELLNASAVVVMVGERPGLSSPDSLGIYLTWQPRVGRTDAERNCISNVRPQGLSYAEAARRLVYLLKESRRLSLSGVNLKDRTKSDVIEVQSSAKNFLLPQ